MAAQRAGAVDPGPVGAAQPVMEGGGHREKDDEGRHRHLGGQAIAQPQHQDRRQREDRDRLADHQHRHQPAPDLARQRHDQRRGDAQRHAQQQADDDFRQGYARMGQDDVAALYQGGIDIGRAGQQEGFDAGQRHQRLPGQQQAGQRHDRAEQHPAQGAHISEKECAVHVLFPTPVLTGSGSWGRRIPAWEATSQPYGSPEVGANYGTGIPSCKGRSAHATIDRMRSATYLKPHA